MKYLRTLLIVLAMFAATPGTARATVAVPIDKSVPPTSTYFYAYCGGQTLTNAMQDVSPPAAPSTDCGIYTATNGTVTYTFAGHPTGPAAAYAYVNSPDRTGTVSLLDNGVSVASTAVAKGVNGWIMLPKAHVDGSDTLALRVKMGYQDSTGRTRVFALHMDVGDDPIIYGKPDSAWNTPIPDNVLVDANSAGAISQFTADLNQTNPYINTPDKGYASDIYRATPDTPRVGVYIGQSDGTQSNTTKQLQEAFTPGVSEAMTGIPDPDLYGYQPVTGDTDYEYAAYCAACTSPDGTRVGYTWDLWRLAKCDGNTSLGAAGIAAGYTWCARWGGRDSGVQESPGHPTRDWEGYAYPTAPDPSDPALATKAAKFEDPGWMATATSLPLAAGTITEADVDSGHIGHALGISVIHPLKSAWYWPAQRTDGYVASDGTDMREGSRIQVDPSIDCATYMRTIIGQEICQAGQQFGWIVWDKSGAVGFRAERTVKSSIWWDSSSAQYQQLDGIRSLPLRVVAPGTDSAPFQ